MTLCSTGVLFIAPDHRLTKPKVPRGHSRGHLNSLCVYTVNAFGDVVPDSALACACQLRNRVAVTGLHPHRHDHVLKASRRCQCLSKSRGAQVDRHLLRQVRQDNGQCLFPPFILEECRQPSPLPSWTYFNNTSALFDEVEPELGSKSKT